MSSNKEKLATYLQDHYAGGVAAIELLEHLAKTHEGQPLGAFLQDLLANVSSDHKTLARLMTALEIKESTVRNAGAWIAEKMARPKLALGGADEGLQVLQALETLFIGITGKRLLWRALASVVADRILPETNFAELETRALEQLDRVEAKRLEVARAAFGGN